MRLDDQAETYRLAADLARGWTAGDVVLLEGPLGVGKTTFVRGVLAALGWQRDVRSPTFNLLQLYDTDPPVAHADLYRVSSTEGIGLEAYLDTHLTFVEWPDRFRLIDAARCWRLEFRFVSDNSEGRQVAVTPPSVLG